MAIIGWFVSKIFRINCILPDVLKLSKVPLSFLSLWLSFSLPSFKYEVNALHVHIYPSCPRFSLDLAEVQRNSQSKTISDTKVFFIPEMKTKQMFRTLCFALAPSLAACFENILAPKLVLDLFISSWAQWTFHSHPFQTTLFSFLSWSLFCTQPSFHGPCE